MIMEQLVKSEAYITVVTKSKLILRDIDLLKKMKHVEVALSISIIDEQLKKKLEPNSSSIQERFETLKELKQNGIKTIVFVAPVIPEITDFKTIFEKTKEYTDEYWFDMLNLRSSFKTKMFKFINEEYPIYNSIYENIYNKKDREYFDNLSNEIEKYCVENNISFKNFSAGS